MEKSLQIGFPAPLLGMRPVRLPILFDDGELLVLAKPIGVLVQADSWYPKLPVLVEAIRHQSRKGKKEFERLNIAEDGLWAVTNLDPECYGPVLFCRDRVKAESLRGVYGSGAFQFTYSFLSKGHVSTSSLECDLPITRHRQYPRMLVSHTTGKKTFTSFELVDQVGFCQQWQARATFPRRHQILLHAYESGLPVVGDRIYAKDPLPLLSDFKRSYQPKYNEEERPLYDGPAVFLKELRFGDDKVAECPNPPRWSGLLKQLQMHTHSPER